MMQALITHGGVFVNDGYVEFSNCQITLGEASYTIKVRAVGLVLNSIGSRMGFLTDIKPVWRIVYVEASSEQTVPLALNVDTQEIAQIDAKNYSYEAQMLASNVQARWEDMVAASVDIAHDPDCGTGESYSVDQSAFDEIYNYLNNNPPSR